MTGTDEALDELGIGDGLDSVEEDGAGTEIVCAAIGGVAGAVTLGRETGVVPGAVFAGAGVALEELARVFELGSIEDEEDNDVEEDNALVGLGEG